MSIRVSGDCSEVNFPALTSTNQLVIDYFSRLPDGARMEAFERALAIGVMALKEERVAAFLASTEHELSVHLESLKRLYDSNQMALKSASHKGAQGELAVAQALTNFNDCRGYRDVVQLIGSISGALPRNKTGDLICTVGEGDATASIVIECKLDKSVRLGDPSLDGLTKGRSDTAWSQLIEARANRQADVAIMVFSADATDRSIGAFTDSVRYIQGVGFIALIDLPRGDFRPLAIAYELAREQALCKLAQPSDPEQLDVLMRKMCADLSDALRVKEHLQTARSAIDAANSQVEHALFQFSATRDAVLQYLRTGRLDNRQLLQLLVPHKVVPSVVNKVNVETLPT